MSKSNAKEPPIKKIVKAKTAKAVKPIKSVKKPLLKKNAVKEKKAPFKKSTPIVEPKVRHQINVDIIADDDTAEEAPAYRQAEYFSAAQLAGEPDREMADDDSVDDEEDSVSENSGHYQADIDKQKNFFNEWANNMNGNVAERTAVAPAKKSIRLYSRFVFSFLSLLAVIVLVVLYFFIPTLTVVITPEGQTVNDSLSFNVVTASSTVPSLAASSTLTSLSASSTYATIDNNAYNENINGTIKEVSFDATQTYSSTGEEPSSQNITGQVTLINTTANNQPLVVKTRLLSPDGKLFRLKQPVDVPANGQVTAEIYTDNPSQDMAIGPTRFTIPGLWSGLQDKIYAQSNAAFTYNNNVAKIVSQSDLDQANQNILDILDTKIKNSLISTDQNTVLVYGSESAPLVTDDAKVNDNRDQFNATAQKKVVMITFPKNIISQLAQAKLSMLIPDDQQLTAFDDSQISYTLENYDNVNQVATVKADFSGIITLKQDSKILDPQKLVGLNQDQITQYLNGLSEIKSYQLQFSPTFITTAPNLVDRIKIVTQTSNN
jgi:hypothetical protein